MKRNSEHAKGLLVVIGSTRASHPVLIAWTRRGEELALRDLVQLFACEPVYVLHTAVATTAAVERFKAKHKKAWRCGYWYSRTPAIGRAMQVRKAA
jgi:hypothetical protein